MRVVKEHEERRNEIIDTAAVLFAKKGYQKCSVNDILTEIGIAKGTFYYYFASKEEVLDAIIEKSVEQVSVNVEQVIKMPMLTSDEKLLAGFMAMGQDTLSSGFIEEMHKPENALMHQKSLTGIINVLVPLFTGVVEEGVQKGDYRCEYPKEDMKIFLTASITLLDDGIFMESPEEKQRTFAALISMLEQMLQVEKNQFLSQAMKHWKF